LKDLKNGWGRQIGAATIHSNLSKFDVAIDGKVALFPLAQL